MAEALREPLPPLYDRWVTDLLGGVIPRESPATCDNCAMLDHGGRGVCGGRTLFFDTGVKCCTWIPTLPNFLVGRILADSDPVGELGRTTVAARIEGRIGVSPLGLAPPPVFSLLYYNGSNVFGRARSLKCPHYIEDGGRCGVWRHRNSTCSTWFCKHARGSVGFEFWRESLYPLLQVVERTLARWCVLELQISAETLRHLVSSYGWNGDAEPVTGDLIDKRIDETAYARMWGEWRGREQELFRRCAEMVSPLSWRDVLAICGAEGLAYARLAQEAYGRLMSEEIPPALETGSFQLVQIADGMSRIATYSDFDPLDVPQAVMELLQFFDGRPTDEALSIIAAERGIRLEPDLVRKLVDFKVLVVPEKATSGRA